MILFFKMIQPNFTKLDTLSDYINRSLFVNFENKIERVKRKLWSNECAVFCAIRKPRNVVSCLWATFKAKHTCAMLSPTSIQKLLKLGIHNLEWVCGTISMTPWWRHHQLLNYNYNDSKFIISKNNSWTTQRRNFYNQCITGKVLNIEWN